VLLQGTQPIGVRPVGDIGLLRLFGADEAGYLPSSAWTAIVADGMPNLGRGAVGIGPHPARISTRRRRKRLECTLFQRYPRRGTVEGMDEKPLNSVARLSPARTSAAIAQR
jgi:hypothetical protein